MTALTFFGGAGLFFTLVLPPSAYVLLISRPSLPWPPLPVGMWVLIDYLFLLERPSSDDEDDWMCNYLFVASIVM